MAGDQQAGARPEGLGGMEKNLDFPSAGGIHWRVLSIGMISSGSHFIKNPLAAVYTMDLGSWVSVKHGDTGECHHLHIMKT